MIIGIYNPPAFITLAGLICGFSACWLASSGQLELAVVALIWAGIFDLFDGMVARRLNLTKQEAAFGIQIDSIVDIVSFGVAPVMIGLQLTDAGIMAVIIGGFYICAAAQRLAYFNVTQATTEKTITHYTGLPVTFAALIFGLAFCLQYVLTATGFSLVINGLFLIVGCLYIYPIKIPKPKGSVYCIMPLLAIIMTAFWLWRACD